MQKTIEITTTQNVTIEYELASLRERALAWMLDTAIIMFGYFVLAEVFVLVFARLINGEPFWMVFLGLSLFLVYFLYNIVFEILNHGQTLGKKAMNIRVLRLDGKDPEWSDVTLRALLQLVDTLFSAGVIGALFLKTTDKSQRLGDMAANTSVVRIYNTGLLFRLEDILNIATLDNYQPVYPQVRNLDEKDMIFIKKALSRLQHYPNDANREMVNALVAHLLPILQIDPPTPYAPEFLRTLLRDYIVLTR